MCFGSVVNFIFKDLPSVLILIIAHQISNDCRTVVKNTTDVYVHVQVNYIPLLTFLINLSETSITLHEIFLINIIKPVGPNR